MAALSLTQLTETTLDGTGVFDALMRANKAHLEAEFSKGRIKGTEYATVYLGSLEAVMKTSMEFLMQREKNQLEVELLDQQVLLAKAKLINTAKEGLILDAQKCKLDAEFDLLQSEKLKSTAETALLAQKNATERAQTTAMGVDDDSVIGKQKSLYQAQTTGFARDAEQKAAKLMVDTWNVRRTTDPDAADINAINQLTDASVGRAVAKMLGGVGA